MKASHSMPSQPDLARTIVRVIDQPGRKGNLRARIGIATTVRPIVMIWLLLLLDALLKRNFWGCV